MKKRLFIAIPLDPELKAGLEKFISLAGKDNPTPIPPPLTLRGGGGGRGDFSLFSKIRWTAPENLHITVYFLGDVKEQKIPDLIEKLKSVLIDVKPFPLEFNGVILAPSHHEPNMIWAVFKSSEDYKNLVDKISKVYREFSGHMDRKESIPHITLARFKDPSVARKSKLEQPKPDSKILKVDLVELVSSRLNRDGPKYTLVKKVPLGGTSNQIP